MYSRQHANKPESSVSNALRKPTLIENAESSAQAEESSQSANRNHILALQQKYGNQYVQRYLNKNLVQQRAPGNRVQGYMLQQATNVTGNQFEAQVMQDNGSFKDDEGKVVVENGGNDTQLRVSEDGKLAIEDSDLSHRQPKVFYATTQIVKDSNKILKKAKSEFELFIAQMNAISVQDSKGKTVQLNRVLARKATYDPTSDDGGNSSESGLGLTVDNVCGTVAQKVTGIDPTVVLPKLKKKLGINSITAPEYNVARYFFEYAFYGAKEAKKDVNDDVLNPQSQENIAKMYSWVLQSDPVAAAEIAELLGVNEYADPKVGEMFGIITLGTSMAGTKDFGTNPEGDAPLPPTQDDDTKESGKKRNYWATHYGGVVAESAGNKITLENYARLHEEGAMLGDAQPIYYFQMYGNVPSQSWHKAWTSTPGASAINPITMVYGRGK